MTSIKIKFRDSQKQEGWGTCFIQVIHKRKMKTIATGIRLRKSEWDPSDERISATGATVYRSKELRLMQEQLDKITLSLQETIIRLNSTEGYFTTDTIAQYYKERNFRRSFFAIIKERISLLKKNGQKRTSSNYSSALNMFNKFREGQDVMPDEISEILIKEFEYFLKAKGNSLNTISFYMRILQATYNYAVGKQWIEKDTHPFKGVFRGEEKTLKRAVDRSVVGALEKLDVSATPDLALAKDMFLFSLYTCGMSYIDIAHLQKRDIKGKILEYKRHKTGQIMQIGLTPYASSLIHKYAGSMEGAEYLFPILYHPKRQKYRSYDSALKIYNRKLKKLSQIIGLPQPLTSYVSRHTWATLAKNLGIATHIISDAMGHTSEETTRIYLDKINNNTLDQANNAVIASFNSTKRR